MPTPTIGHWLKQRRALLGLTQSDLARAAACSPSLIRKYESGERRPPRPTAERLADALQIAAGQRADFIAAALGAPAVEPAERPPRYPGYLPAPATPLFGREGDLDALGRRLLDPQTRLVSLLGPPGVGKSRLAIAAARLVADAFDDGVCMVDLAPVAEADLVFPAVARALGRRLSPDRPPAEQLAAALDGRRVLLLLDNFEHVLAAARPLARLLDACPTLRLLVTSRAPLRLRAERRYLVEPLALPADAGVGPPDMAALTASPALQLFAERAQAVVPGWDLSAERAPLAAAICARLDGLPLAIELAAARCDSLSLPELLAALEQPLAALTDGPHDLPPHQQALRNAIAWSYRLLSAEEQRSFRRLAVFRGGCTAAAAAAVGATALGPLLHAGLLQRHERAGEPRYALLETLRAFGLEQLSDPAEHAEAMRRHGEHFAGLADTAAPQLYAAAGPALSAQLDTELPNLQSAIVSSLAGDGLAAARIVGQLGTYWLRRGIYDLIAPVADLVEHEPSGLPAPVRALAAHQLGFCLAQTARHSRRSPALLRLALGLYRELGDQASSAGTLIALAMIARYPGNQQYVLALLDEAASMAKAAGLPQLVAAHEQLGKLYLELGDAARAAQHVRAALALAEASGQVLRRVRTTLDLGLVALIQLDLVAARASYGEVVAHSRSIGDRHALGEALGGLGLLEALADNHDAAEAHCAEAIALLTAAHAEVTALPVRCVQGYLALARADSAGAARIFDATLGFACASFYLPPVACCLAGLARLAALAGDLTAAARLIGAGDTIVERFGMRPALLHSRLIDLAAAALDGRADLAAERAAAAARARARLPRVAFETSYEALAEIDLAGAIAAARQSEGER
jgi:predicted ATPase/transcriptional regulator with XRE-family HTH domain